MAASCLFHSNRSGFEQVVKDLYKSTWIPRSYCQRLGMAVCCCRKKLGPLPDQQEYEKATECVMKEVAINKQLTQFLKNYIDCVLHSVSFTDYSTCRFIHILYEAKHSQYHSLSRESLSNNENKVSACENSKTIKKQKLTREQMEFMKRRRKLKMVSKVICLKMYPGVSGTFERNLGMDLEKYCVQNKCYISYEKALNDVSMSTNRESTYIKVWCKDSGSLTEVENHLQVIAVRSQAEMRKQRAQWKAEKRRRRLNFYRQVADVEEEEDYDENSKDVLWDDFARKTWNERHRHRGKGIQESSILKGGHCHYCLKTFPGLHHQNSDCRYHPGYIEKQQWTCCQTDTENTSATMEDHRNTGCCNGVHSWRVHKKATRKASVNLSHQFRPLQTISHGYSCHSVIQMLAYKGY